MQFKISFKLSYLSTSNLAWNIIYLHNLLSCKSWKYIRMQEDVQNIKSHACLHKWVLLHFTYMYVWRMLNRHFIVVGFGNYFYSTFCHTFPKYITINKGNKTFVQYTLVVCTPGAYFLIDDYCIQITMYAYIHYTRLYPTWTRCPFQCKCTANMT